MLKLEKNNALTRSQLAKKAIKKIPLYEVKNSNKSKVDTVKVPFLDRSLHKIRYLSFSNLSGYSGNSEWTFIEIID